eukprot:Blabericola_migrator_1__7833@NODE_3_length_32604_cov_133_371700_g2_i0_p1_GENE_NODE_3_length_32604_cov_133_371700_g2_i0NODE_3_length_32604_cov_133_371700_g2_i0_p1_ORF_typecomplete_len1248_score243_35ANAPC4_WD40/PF12894_7/2e06ANAPC4_WD40/PF12894_7/58ANAPC4_WD40/PF12894_7/1_4e05ANAPC4_WD40/PF12894_7/4_9e05ANAPC4_WD40/PF12894_7/7_9e02WD40/PF00400_32/1_7e02WD40/PF00400_32/0_00033WD40/PF00400_32/1_4e07WD40/PF00400_32/28WD40/PF00400_32/1_4e04Nup160/PF11715_8/41Nup160/PF11715_8/5_6e08WD40_like/PF17005_5
MQEPLLKKVPEDLDSFHAAILQFLLHKFPVTAKSFSKETGLTNADVTRIINTDGLLEKKWSATTKLQMSLMVHEKQIAAKDLKLEMLEGLFRLKKASDIQLPRDLSSQRTPSKIEPGTDLIYASPQAPCIATASTKKSRVDLWGVDSMNEAVLEASVTAASEVVALSFDPLGHIMIIGSAGPTLEIYDVKAWNMINKLKTAGTKILSIHTYLAESSNPFKFQTTFHTLLTTRDLSIQLWDVVEGICLHTTTPGNGIPKATCVVGTKYFCVGLADGRIATYALHDRNSPEALGEFKGHDRPIECLSALTVVADRHKFASAGRDSAVKIWDAATKECIYTLVSHHNWIRLLALHPLGPVLVSGGDDRSIKFWDAETGRLLRSINESYARGLNGLTFMSTGSYLCTSSDDAPLTLWVCDLPLSQVDSVPVVSRVEDSKEIRKSNVSAAPTSSAASSPTIRSTRPSVDSVNGVALPSSLKPNDSSVDHLDDPHNVSPTASPAETLKSSHKTTASGLKRINVNKLSSTQPNTQRRRQAKGHSSDVASPPRPQTARPTVSTALLTESAEKRAAAATAVAENKVKKLSSVVKDSKRQTTDPKPTSGTESTFSKPRQTATQAYVSPRGPVSRRDSLLGSGNLRRSSTCSGVTKARSETTMEVSPVVQRPVPLLEEPEVLEGLDKTAPKIKSGRTVSSLFVSDNKTIETESRPVEGSSASPAVMAPPRSDESTIKSSVPAKVVGESTSTKSQSRKIESSEGRTASSQMGAGHAPHSNATYAAPTQSSLSSSAHAHGSHTAPTHAHSMAGHATHNATTHNAATHNATTYSAATQNAATAAHSVGTHTLPAPPNASVQTASTASNQTLPTHPAPTSSTLNTSSGSHTGSTHTAPATSSHTPPTSAKTARDFSKQSPQSREAKPPKESSPSSAVKDSTKVKSLSPTSSADTIVPRPDPKPELQLVQMTSDNKSEMSAGSNPTPLLDHDVEPNKENLYPTPHFASATNVRKDAAKPTAPANFGVRATPKTTHPTIQKTGSMTNIAKPASLTKIPSGTNITPKPVPASSIGNTLQATANLKRATAKAAAALSAGSTKTAPRTSTSTGPVATKPKAPTLPAPASSGSLRPMNSTGSTTSSIPMKPGPKPTSSTVKAKLVTSPTAPTKTTSPAPTKPTTTTKLAKTNTTLSVGSPNANTQRSPKAASTGSTKMVLESVTNTTSKNTPSFAGATGRASPGIRQTAATASSTRQPAPKVSPPNKS